MSIVSARLPSQPLPTPNVLISHELQPVAEVGGDYLDYFELADGSVGRYVGDVSEKGQPAALMPRVPWAPCLASTRRDNSPAGSLAAQRAVVFSWYSGAPRGSAVCAVLSAVRGNAYCQRRAARDDADPRRRMPNSSDSRDAPGLFPKSDYEGFPCCLRREILCVSAAMVSRKPAIAVICKLVWRVSQRSAGPTPTGKIRSIVWSGSSPH
jgi:hypothetical protein